MSPDDHALRAEELLSEAEERTSGQDDPLLVAMEVANLVGRAQVHATLAARQPKVRYDQRLGKL